MVCSFLSFPLALIHTHHVTYTPVLGKAEGMGPEWHGHVTALTVAPEYRRLGMARKMMHLLELVSDEIYKGFFVDLYVRCANKLAIEMYEGMGYSVYRRVREYYGSLGVGRGGRDEEDAFGEFGLVPTNPCKPLFFFFSICGEGLGSLNILLICAIMEQICGNQCQEI